MNRQAFTKQHLSARTSRWLVLNAEGTLGIGHGFDFVVSEQKGFDPTVQDVIFRMDWVGNTIKGWAWLPGPGQPPGK